MGSKILLADDSITIQKVVNLTFDDEGIEVVAVSNGDQAERKLGEVKPDLVLADIFMPGKNGYELCEFIKQSPQFSNVPVVLLVGAFEPFDLNEARRVGADDHLTKPFESRKLVETVRRLISIREQSRPPQPPAAAEQERSERATDSLEDRSERTTDPLDAKPFVRTSDLDAPSATQEAAPALDVVTSAGDAAALNESAPLELDYTAEQATGEGPAADFHFSPPEETGDLSTESFNEEIAFETTPLDDLTFPVDDQPSQVMLETGDARPQSESFDQAPHSFSFGEGTVDFEKLDQADPSIGRQTLEWASEPPAWQPSLHDSSRVDAGYAASEQADSASTTLLAVEDPLGDVLTDVAPQQQAVFEGQWQPAEMGEATELNLDFPSAEAAPLPPISEVAPDYAASHMEESATAAEAPADVEPPPVEPEIVFNPEQTQPEEEAQTEVAEPQSDSGQDAEPVYEPASYETRPFQPEMAEPVDGAGAEFTSSSMWTEQESRFAPIDIEAVPVDEAEALRASQPHPVERETGFEFSHIITEEPAATPDYAPAAEREPAATSEAAAASEPAPQVVDLSQAAIDEIVKRVVAELSDRVVREIAWEVVPDLVERVVEKLARESLSKRS